ncbi:MAG: YkgJ family cysteine cluster protein [Chitinophagales bacterium]
MLNLWEPLANDSLYDKKYAGDSGVCKGCINNCCNAAFVIPDLISFKALCQATTGSPERFLESFVEPDRLLAGIPRVKSNPCIFLKQQVCTVYEARCLICRFYLCTDIEGETEQLIYSVVTAGIAATIIWLEKMGFVKPLSSAKTGFDRALVDLINSYRDHPGTAEFLQASSYKDIKLHHFTT